MPEKADVTGSSLEAGMLFEDFGFFDDIEICIEDDDAVESDADAAAGHHDLFGVPLARRFEEACSSGNDVIN